MATKESLKEWLWEAYGGNFGNNWEKALHTITGRDHGDILADEVMDCLDRAKKADLKRMIEEIKGGEE